MESLRPQLIAVATLLVIAGSADRAFAQGYPVSGTVSAVDATPLAEVSVRLKGTNVVCVTPLNGSYQVTARSSADTLVFRKFGFDPVEVPITTADSPVTSSRNVVHITLRPQANQPRPAVTGRDTRPSTRPAEGNQNVPLYLIDGVLSDAETFDALNPYVIETIRIVRDAATLHRLGEAAGNGVVEVTTMPECEPAS